MNFYFSAYLTTLLVGLLLIATKDWHGRFSMDEFVGVQKFHIHPTPRIGGLAIFIGLLAVYEKMPLATQSLVGPMVWAAIPAFLMGLLEDVTKRVGVVPRLLATMLSGLLAWWLTSVAMQHTGVSLLDSVLRFTPVAVVFTAFAVGGVANSVNIIDGFNGLAAGAVVIMTGTLGLIATHVGDTALASVCFFLVAAILGFGTLNWPLGKVFLGDGGAYMIGFFMAWIAVLLPMRNPSVSGAATMLVCAYPVIEVVYSMMRRRRERKSSGAPDSLHLHSLVKTEIVRKIVPSWSPTMRNSAVSPIIWIFAALPALMGAYFYDKPPSILAVCLLISVVIYHSVYKALLIRRLKANGHSYYPVSESRSTVSPNTLSVYQKQKKISSSGMR